MIASSKTNHAHLSAHFAVPAVSSPSSTERHLQGDLDAGAAIVGKEHPVGPFLTDSRLELFCQLKGRGMCAGREEDVAVPASSLSSRQCQRLGCVTVRLTIASARTQERQLT